MPGAVLDFRLEIFVPSANRRTAFFSKGKLPGTPARFLRLYQ